jgi:hypothetical protein
LKWSEQRSKAFSEFQTQRHQYLTQRLQLFHAVRSAASRVRTTVRDVVAPVLATEHLNFPAEGLLWLPPLSAKPTTADPDAFLPRLVAARAGYIMPFDWRTLGRSEQHRHRLQPLRMQEDESSRRMRGHFVLLPSLPGFVALELENPFARLFTRSFELRPS